MENETEVNGNTILTQKLFGPYNHWFSLTCFRMLRNFEMEQLYFFNCIAKTIGKWVKVMINLLEKKRRYHLRNNIDILNGFSM